MWESYTQTLFRIFQDELVGSQMFIVEKVESSIDVPIYKVQEIYKQKPSYCMTFHIPSKEVNCYCHLFKFFGILCRHVLFVLIKKEIVAFPSKYILRH